MKKLLLMLLITASMTAQQKFEFKKEGLTDYVVTEVKGTAPELYTKTINWVKETYKNPDEVIKMKIDNEKIRIEGFQKNFNCISSVCADALYTIEISFKDDKYKFDAVSMEMKNSAGSFTIPLEDFSIYYDKKGELKKQSVEPLNNLVNLFNGLNESLKNYISEVKKSDW